MADVSARRPPTRREGRRRRRRRGSDDRGQLFLVGALALAVLFVGFALLLNTAIYTENLATRNTDPGTDPSISYRAAAEDAAREVMIRENANNTAETDFTFLEVRQRYDRDVGNWSDGVGIHAARRARVANMSLDDGSAVHGTRIEQTNDTRPFTNRSGTATWEVIEDVAVRDVRVTVDRDSLAPSNTTALDNSPFHVEIEESTTGDSYRVYLYDDIDTGGDDVTVAVANATDIEQCTYTGGATATIDVSNGSINGTACDAFELLDLTDSEVDSENLEVEFVNGDNAVGTYELTVSTGVAFGTGTNFYDNGGTGAGEGSPFLSAVIYEADVVVTYESTDVYYRTTVAIDPPGEIR
jgi:hypothetical protein